MAQRGVTLLEAMISVTVLIIGTLGLFAAHGQAVGADRRSRAWTLANEVAMDLVEHLQQLPFNHPLLSDASTANDDVADFSQAHLGGNPATGVDFFSVPPDHNADGTDAELGAGWPGGTYPGVPLKADSTAGKVLGANDLGDYDFHRYWNVQPQGAPANNGITEIAVIVTYNDGSGSRKAVVVHGTVFDMRAIPQALAGPQ